MSELIDLNGDSLPDVLETRSGEHIWYENLGDLGWAAPRLLEGDIERQLSDGSVKLGDMDGDLRADLVVRRGRAAHTFVYHRLESAVPSWKDSSIRFHGDEFDFDLSDRNVRFVDLNNDRRIDLLRTSTSATWEVWINEGPDENDEHRFSYSAVQPATASTFSRGMRLADLNGDGLVDLVDVRSLGVTYWASRGHGRWDEARDLANAPELEDAAEARAIDVNRDGLADLILVESGQVTWWINQGGARFSAPVRIGDVPELSSDTSIRFADVNGNGSQDVLWIDPRRPKDEQYRFLDLCPRKPNLLARVRNNRGRELEIEYRSSTHIAMSANVPWIRKLPVSIDVVSQTREHDSRGTVDLRRMTYRNGDFGDDDRRFHGFGEAIVERPGNDYEAGSLERFEFYTGRDGLWLKGRERSSELLRLDGTRIRRTLSNWTVRTLFGDLPNGERVAFAFKDREVIEYFEGRAKPLEVAIEFERDQYGNVVLEQKLGVTGVGGDETTIRREYAQHVNEESWVVRYRTCQVVEDGAGRRVSEVRFLWDQLPRGRVERGNLTQRLHWFDDRDGFVPVLIQRFDQWGNVVEIRNGLDNRRTVEFDSTYHVYPIREIFHLAGYQLQVEAGYDLGIGEVVWYRDHSVVGRSNG
ncbi:MAG: FG-GAP-like repeat-containing protein, partial [Planctomycetota bacterium]